MVEFLLPLVLVLSFTATAVGTLFLTVALAITAYPVLSVRGLCLALGIVLAAVWTASVVAAMMDRYLGPAFSEPIFFRYGGVLAFALLLNSSSSTDLMIAALHAAVQGDTRLYTAAFLTVIGNVVMGSAVVALAVMGTLVSIELPIQWFARAGRIPLLRTMEGVRPFLVILTSGLIMQQAGQWIVARLLP